MSDELATITQNAALMEAYGGVEEESDGLDAGGSLPILTIVQKEDVEYLNQEGIAPARGSLFHVETAQEFKGDVDTTIFYVCECELPKYSKTPEDKDYWQKNYIVGGIIQGSDVPFWAFVRGMSYNKIWSLSEEMRPYRGRGATKLPKLGFTVTIGTELGEKGKKVLSNGKTQEFEAKHVFTFKLKRNEDGSPIVETDLSRVAVLKRMSDVIHTSIDDYVDRNAKEKPVKLASVQVTTIRGNQPQQVSAVSVTNEPPHPAATEDDGQPPF